MNPMAVFSQMIVLFVVIIIGFIAAKLKFINEKTNTELSSVLVFITIPMQVISSTLKPGGTAISLKNAAIVTGLSFLIYFILIFVSMLLPFILKDEKKQTNCYRFMFIFSNVGQVGFYLIDTIFGEDYRFYAAIFILAYNCFCWTYGVALMSGEKFKIDKEVFKRPLVIASLLAFVLFFTKVGSYCPAVVYKSLSAIGDTTPIIAMLITGSALASLPLKKVFGKWQIWVLCLIKLLVFPIVFWAVMRFFITDNIMLCILTVMVSMPVGTMATSVSYQYGGDEQVASAGIFLSTVLSVFTIPILMKFLFWV